MITRIIKIVCYLLFCLLIISCATQRLTKPEYDSILAGDNALLNTVNDDIFDELSPIYNFRTKFTIGEEAKVIVTHVDTNRIEEPYPSEVNQQILVPPGKRLIKGTCKSIENEHHEARGII